MNPDHVIGWTLLAVSVLASVTALVIVAAAWCLDRRDTALMAALSDLDDPCETYEAAHGWIPADTWEHFEAWERQMRPYDWREAGL